MTSNSASDKGVVAGAMDMIDRIVVMNLHSSVAALGDATTLCRPTTLARMLAIAAALCLLGACGQKGPLTLPKAPAPAVGASAPAQ